MIHRLPKRRTPQVYDFDTVCGIVASFQNTFTATFLGLSEEEVAARLLHQIRSEPFNGAQQAAKMPYAGRAGLLFERSELYSAEIVPRVSYSSVRVAALPEWSEEWQRSTCERLLIPQAEPEWSRF